MSAAHEVGKAGRIEPRVVERVHVERVVRMEVVHREQAGLTRGVGPAEQPAVELGVRVVCIDLPG